jgi:hypothetical protein
MHVQGDPLLAPDIQTLRKNLNSQQAPQNSAAGADASAIPFSHDAVAGAQQHTQDACNAPAAASAAGSNNDGAKVPRSSTASSQQPQVRRKGCNRGYLQVDAAHASQLTYQEFAMQYMAGNKPVLIKVSTPKVLYSLNCGPIGTTPHSASVHDLP